MEPDHTTGLESRSPTARCLSAKVGSPGAQSQLGHTRSHMTCSQIAVGENRAGSGKGWLR
jgi:hypothetical protein